MFASKAPARDRLDRLLVDRGLAPTRAKAQALILAGRVFSAGTRLDKPGARIPREAALEVSPAPQYVSRGGPKLAGALERFGLDISGRDVIDVGASTGGFTQVLLEGGARRVAAIDVGRGQLDWGLRNRPEVTVLDRVNARHLRPETLPFRPSLAVIDVSFISLRLVLPPVMGCLAPGGECVALIKPQFEVGRGEVGRGGIVSRPEQHEAVLRRIAGFVVDQGWAVRGLALSELPGAEGNREFFVRISAAPGGLDPDGLELSIRSTLDEVQRS